MVNASGGFAYIDMSVFGVFTPGTAKTVDLTIGDTLNKVKQISKPVIITGLQIDIDGTVTSIPAAVVTFIPGEEVIYSASISGGEVYIGIGINTYANQIVVST